MSGSDIKFRHDFRISLRIERSGRKTAQ